MGYIKKVTYDEYDQLIEKMESLTPGHYWPTPEQFFTFEKDPQRWLPFCIYLYETNPPTENNKERYSKKNLNAFIRDHLEFIDNEE